ncbi:hypothetical protein ACFL0Y_00110 [Patescibacteria group bacterium]
MKIKVEGIPIVPLVGLKEDFSVYRKTPGPHCPGKGGYRVRDDFYLQRGKDVRIRQKLSARR